MKVKVKGQKGHSITKMVIEFDNNEGRELLDKIWYLDPNEKMICKITDKMFSFLR